PRSPAAHPQRPDAPDEGPRIRPRLPIRARLRRPDRGHGLPPRRARGTPVLRAERRRRGEGNQGAPRQDARGAEKLASLSVTHVPEVAEDPVRIAPALLVEEVARRR